MNSTNQLPLILEQLCQGVHLSQAQAYAQFKHFLDGNLNLVEMSAFLTALKAKGESPDEIIGALNVLQQAANPFPNSALLKSQHDIVDCVGTGGDGQQTLNISTATAFVLASLDVKVAKHGNRAVSSRCGSADLFEKLGVNLEMPPHIAQKALEDIGLCFLYAPFYHPAINQIRQVRSTLKVKTLFNLLGPLLNPLQPQIMLVGVYHPSLCHLIAQVLQKTGVKRALVVHGEGLDEMAIHGPTTGYLLKDNEISDFRFEPQQVGLTHYGLSQLKGQDPEFNTKACLDLLQGKGLAAYRASVALNSGAILYLMDKADTIKEGTDIAQDVMSTALAYEKLLKLKEVSHAQ